jgi:Na+:H+ antiporter, NhaA family
MAQRRKRPLPTQVASTRALREFLATELVGGVVLLVATVAALVWANSAWKGGYEQLWGTELGIELGRWRLALDLREWVNEGLMAVFFVLVGLELKREFLQGELRGGRRAALPVVAAIGGMVVPALLYSVFNLGGEGADGWGIPMATDIAFALGVLAVVAPGVPATLRLFLLTLAIVDDIGAIVVIAAFYTSDLEPAWLAAAFAVLIAVYGLRQVGLTFTPLFVALGAALWLALHASGVHATLAGVAMGLLAPATPQLEREIVRSRGDELLDVFSAEAARTTTRLARQSVSQLEWLEHTLHPWSSLVVIPVFALANAGVSLTGEVMRDALTSPVTLGVLVGLVAGKTLGITGAAWLAYRTGLAELPSDVPFRQIAGVAALGGIGFTVSLFVTELAFDDASIAAEAKVGILAASLAATLLGWLLLSAHNRTSAVQNT